MKERTYLKKVGFVGLGQSFRWFLFSRDNSLITILCMSLTGVGYITRNIETGEINK